MTGLFPWEHICHFSGARPKARRGITNEVVLLEGKLITNDNSNNGLGQNLKVDSSPAVLRFSPFKLKTGREQQGFLFLLLFFFLLKWLFAGGIIQKRNTAGRRGDASS